MTKCNTFRIKLWYLTKVKAKGWSNAFYRKFGLKPFHMAMKFIGKKGLV